jgi:hypothetical protein
VPEATPGLRPDHLELGVGSPRSRSRSPPAAAARLATRRSRPQGTRQSASATRPASRNPIGLPTSSLRLATVDMGPKATTVASGVKDSLSQYAQACQGRTDGRNSPFPRNSGCQLTSEWHERRVLQRWCEHRRSAPMLSRAKQSRLVGGLRRVSSASGQASKDRTVRPGPTWSGKTVGELTYLITLR